MTVSVYPDLRVYTRQTWAGAWIERPDLRPISARHCAAPETSVAKLKQFYGLVKQETDTAFAAVAPADYSDHYLCIEFTDAGGETTCWYGIVDEYTLDLWGKDAQNPTGIQLITAHGLETILDKIPIVEAWTSEGPFLTQIGRVPTFNLEHESGGTFVGNRSEEYHGDSGGGAYAFSRDGEIWTLSDILEYLIRFHARLTASALPFALSGQWADFDEYWLPPTDLEGLSLRAAFDKLLDRRRGYSWCIRVDPYTDDILIHVFSCFPSDVTVGTWTFHANAEQMALDARSRQEISSALVRVSRSVLYDEVRVLGARLKAYFSVTVFDDELEPAWDDDESYAYR